MTSGVAAIRVPLRHTGRGCEIPERGTLTHMGVSRRRILLIDDSPSIRLAVRSYLEDAGFAVSEAENCAAALEQLGSQPPDAAVMDYMLPDGTALDLLPKCGDVP